MWGYILRRGAASLLLVALVLSATFFLVHLAPGEPAQLFENPRMTEAQRDQLRVLYGLDRPLIEQYGRWLLATASGDWGASFTHRRPALDLLMQRLPATLLLAAATLIVEHVVGLWLALLAIRRPGSRLDRLVRGASMVLWATPVFVLAIVVIEIFAVRLGWFPSQHMRSDGAIAWPWWHQVLDLLHHLALPAITFGLLRCAAVTRFLRHGLVEVMSQDFIRTARAIGLSERRVLWAHALPNALGPLIQRLGTSLPSLLGGSVIIEVIFSWPGIGTAIFGAILQRDYPVILAATAFVAILVVIGNLLADLLQAWLDPRVRTRYA